MTWARRAVVPAAVFAVVVVSHFSGIITSFDSRWSIPVARSLLYQGNTNLDEYVDLLAMDRFYGIQSVDNHYYSMFPIGVSLVALPVVALLDATGIKLPFGKTEKLVASLVVALTAVALYALARRSLDVPRALLVTFVFAFCTAAWSTASRALWQHGPSMLMLTLTLCIFVQARARPALVPLAGLPLAFSYVIRPTDAISIGLLSLLVLIEYRVFFVRYMLVAASVAMPFILFSLSVHHSLLPPYYSPDRIGHALTFGEALIGNLISPNRGLFVFSPVLLLSVYGAWRLLRRAGKLLDWFLAAIVLLHWLAISSFPHWYGGHSFGNRLFTDMVPYFIYFLIPVIASLPGPPGPGRPARVTAVVGLIAISFFINYRGANTRSVYYWNSDPVDVDVQPSRIWDWRDLQFLRGLGRAGTTEKPSRGRLLHPPIASPSARADPT